MSIADAQAKLFITAALAKVSGKAAARQIVERLCEEARAGEGTLAERVALVPELSRQLGAEKMASIFNHAEAINAAARATQAWLDQRTA